MLMFVLLCPSRMSFWSKLVYTYTVRSHSQKVQAAERCQFGMLHSRCYERAVRRCYSTAGIATGCLRKRPSHLLQSFSLRNISVQDVTGVVECEDKRTSKLSFRCETALVVSAVCCTAVLLNQMYRVPPLLRSFECCTYQAQQPLLLLLLCD